MSRRTWDQSQDDPANVQLLSPARSNEGSECPSWLPTPHSLPSQQSRPRHSSKRRLTSDGLAQVTRSLRGSLRTHPGSAQPVRGLSRPVPRPQTQPPPLVQTKEEQVLFVHFTNCNAVVDWVLAGHKALLSPSHVDVFNSSYHPLGQVLLPPSNR